MATNRIDRPILRESDREFDSQTPWALRLAFVLFSLAATTVLFGLVVGYSGTIDRNFALWGGVAVLGLICAVPIVQYAARAKRYDALQPALALALVAFLAYGLGALY